MAFDYEQMATEILETHAVQRDVSILHTPGGDELHELRDPDYDEHREFSIEVQNPSFEGTAADKLYPLPSFVNGLNNFVELGEPVVECHLLANALIKAWDDRWPIKAGSETVGVDA